MPNNNEQQYEPLTFDAIKIGTWLHLKNPGVVQR